MNGDGLEHTDVNLSQTPALMEAGLSRVDPSNIFYLGR